MIHIPASLGQLPWTVGWQNSNYGPGKLIMLWCGDVKPAYVQMNAVQIKQLFEALLEIYGRDMLVDILNGKVAT